MREGPEEELNLTEHAQPAIMASSVLHWNTLKHLYGIRLTDFDFALGQSLGEYSAAVIAGALSLEEGMKLANVRGKAMQTAVTGEAIRMCALKLPENTVRSALADFSVSGVCQISGVNHDLQTVISGQKDAVEAFVQFLKERHGAKGVYLNVSAPFHCSLMQPAADMISKYLSDKTFADPEIPVISSATGQPLTSGSDLKESLVANIIRPAMFLTGFEKCFAEGANTYVELGSKRVLTNIVRQITRSRDLQVTMSEEH
jgi:[acyl-carrier-protein] S-malonyltransferase